MMDLRFLSATGTVIDNAALSGEYRTARSIGAVRIGERHLFVRTGMRVYAFGQDEIRRCYRRVMRVPMKMCCGSGNLDVEYLVVEGDSGELAQVQLPGKRAAVALIALLKERLPNVDYSLPSKAASAEERP